MTEPEASDPELAVEALETAYALFQNMPPPPVLNSDQIRRTEHCARGFLEVAQRDRTWREAVGMKVGPHVRRIKIEQRNGQKYEGKD